MIDLILRAMKRTISLIVTGLLMFTFLANCQEQSSLTADEQLERVSAGTGIQEPVTVSIIYDNYVYKKGLTSDWGFSVLIMGLEKEVLFDTGTKPGLFESNFNELGFDWNGIDILVLSHEHGDHTGGIKALANHRQNIPVIFPYSFSDHFKAWMTEMHLIPMTVKEPAMICNHLYTSGQFDQPTPEQALVLDTGKGLVVITGCSHPGIIEMLKTISTDFRKNVYMVFGGFHLMNKTKAEISDIISEMKSLGVEKCGATHCTGEMQIGMFKEAFGDDFVELGVGNEIKIN